MAKKERVGIVVSRKMLKTIIVAVEIRYQHEKYAKTLIKTKRYMAHDEKQVGKIGDIVSIEECAPISCRKKWILKQILK
jgi:small subunit ribosomal protein S17